MSRGEPVGEDAEMRAHPKGFPLLQGSKPPMPTSGFRVFGGWRIVAARAAAVLGRRDADLIEEEAREVALRREAELRGDLGNLAMAGGQARDCSLDAQHVEVGTGRETGAQL